MLRVFIFAIGFVLLPYVANLWIYILFRVFFYRRLLLLWLGLLQLAVSWVARVRALFTKLLIIMLIGNNIVYVAVLWKTYGFFLPWICIPLLSSNIDPTWHNSSIVVGMQPTLYNKWHNVVNSGWECIELDHLAFLVFFYCLCDRWFYNAKCDFSNGPMVAFTLKDPCMWTPLICPSFTWS